jgi:hypothetical protein
MTHKLIKNNDGVNIDKGMGANLFPTDDGRYHLNNFINSYHIPDLYTSYEILKQRIDNKHHIKNHIKNLLKQQSDYYKINDFICQYHFYIHINLTAFKNDSKNSQLTDIYKSLNEDLNKNNCIELLTVIDNL